MARTSFRVVVTSGFLIGMLFYSAEPAVNPRLIQDEIDLLSHLSDDKIYRKIPEILKEHVREEFIADVRQRVRNLEEQIRAVLGNENIDVELAFNIYIGRNLLFDEAVPLSETLEFWRYFGNQHLLETPWAFGRLKGLTEDPLTLPEDIRALVREGSSGARLALSLMIDGKDCQHGSSLYSSPNLTMRLCIIRIDQSSTEWSSDLSYKMLVTHPKVQGDAPDQVSYNTGSREEYGRVFEGSLNLGYLAALDARILGSERRHISNFSALYRFAEEKGADATFPEAESEAATMGYQNIQSKIDFPFGISMNARSALIVFPFLFLGLVVFAKIHLVLLRRNLEFGADPRDLLYPVSFLAPTILAGSAFSLALSLAAVLPLIALYYNIAIDIEDFSTKLICAAIYSMAGIVTILYIVDIFKTRRLLCDALQDWDV